MSRTRVIYFLSAIVLIIGCFALNTSYSLFVDNDSTQLVETTVPTITDEVTLSLSSIEVEGTKEYLIKQTITNNNSIPMGFRLTASSDSTTYQVQSTTYEDDNYLSYGTVEANTSKDIYLRVINTNEDISNIATINFTLESDYATLKMNTDEYLASANIDNQTQFEIVLVDLPYSDNQDTLTYKIIKRQADRNGAGLSSLFSEQNLKVTLPIESSFNVPTLTTVTGVETEDVGLYQAEDDYGISYFYRGANDKNYVDFADFTWRIVRINGDGSIRLILDGTLDKIKKDNNSIFSNSRLLTIDDDGVVQFNNSLTDQAYIGYMYGEFETNSTSYDMANKNINSSIVKSYVDTFYEEYITSSYIDSNGNIVTNNNKDTKGLGFENYLSDSMFCADKTLSSIRDTDGYGTNKISYYGPYERLIKLSTSIATPTLKCASADIITDIYRSEEQLAYSRYTSIIDNATTTNKGVLVNNDLKYPIALLSADELVLAGAFMSTKNESFYLSNAYNYETPTSYETWWTISPSFILQNKINAAISSKNTSLSNSGLITITHGVRPVINLKSTVLWESGDGTEDSPYTVKLNEEA